MGVIIFNGKSSEDYGIVVENPPAYAMPKRRVESLSVPGRNGNILIDEGVYDNVKRDYNIAAGDIWEEKFTEIAQSMSQWLHSADGYYARLEDSYEPEYYRLATYLDEVEIDNIMQQAGRATISFDCKPQRYLKSGDVFRKFTFMNASDIKNIVNNTLYVSSPIIKVKSTASFVTILTGTLYINNISYEITNAPCTELIIDSEVQDIYDSNGVNMNQYVNLSEFPSFKPGINTIACNNMFLYAEVKPRWWVL